MRHGFSRNPIENMSREEVFKTTDEQVEEMKKLFGRSEKEIAEDIRMIKDWLSKQPHLPQGEDDRYIEVMLLMNKFSLEKTKSKLDMMYAVRTLVPEFFEDRNPLSPLLQKVMDAAMIVPLPNLTDDFCRVHIFRLISDNPDDLDTEGFAKYIFLSIDARCIAHDISMGEHFILDYEKSTMGHIMKTNLALLKKGYQVVSKAYSDRIKGLHFINLPPYAATLLTIANSILSDKMKNRVFVHKDNESLHSVISKKILPEEYGGSEKPLTELNKTWRKYIESNNDWYKLQETRKSNEALRPGSPIDNDMFGVEGSFRQLTVD